MGTLTLRAPTWTAVAVDQAESLARHGFTTILLLSTHRGTERFVASIVASVRATDPSR